MENTVDRILYKLKGAYADAVESKRSDIDDTCYSWDRGLDNFMHSALWTIVDTLEVDVQKAIESAFRDYAESGVMKTDLDRAVEIASTDFDGSW